MSMEPMRFGVGVGLSEIAHIKLLIKGGMTRKAIAKDMKVDPKTIYNWLRKARAMPSLEAQQEVTK